MITDLFSHKLHSSREAWQDKLIDIASVFAEFDGLPYDRVKIEERFKLISPRVSGVASQVARDLSKYRDEISAYPAYLGLYRLQAENGKLIFRLSETAKRFLIVEEPNVPAFMMLQLLLFQYPNGMGARYYKDGNAVIQANARDRTLQFIREGIRVSPFRLICKALLADSKLNGISSLHPLVTIDEIFVLANDDRTDKVASPPLSDVITVLNEVRNGLLSPPANIQRRFHTLDHTDFIQVTNGRIHLREALSPEDAAGLINKLNIIDSIKIEFDGFDAVTNEAELSSLIASGVWGAYFDGVVSLSGEVVQGLTNESFTIPVAAIPGLVNDEDAITVNSTPINLKYPLRERDGILNSSNTYSGKAQAADPEITRIKRQRSNLQHRILLHKMDECIRKVGAVPKESEHIDLFADIPNYGTFLFEVKSVNSENLLSQTRKGVSQLYEYQYRYKAEIGKDVTLCLVYPNEPNEIEWLQEYLCKEREIAVCWFDNDQLRYPKFCTYKVKNLIAQSL